VHELKIHSYPPRKVRVPETCANATIFIVVIVCATAKKRGEQYSKRILPPFVAPYCVIRRDGVLDYLKRNPAGTMHYRMALSMLGALDKRTIRRHLDEGLTLIGRAAMQIAELLSQRAFFGTMPQRALGESEVTYLEAASEELSRAARRAAGARGRSIPCLVLVHIAGVSARHRGPPKVSTTSVLRAVVFCGSS
jgi:Arc/MetJ family transcription regulator